MYNAPTALEITTLVIAVLGFGLAVVGLAWEVAQHRLTGSVVRVELLAGALGQGGVATGPVSTFDFASLAAQGFTTPMFAVRGRNVGRLPVDVADWDIRTADGFAFSLPGFGLWT